MKDNPNYLIKCLIACSQALNTVVFFGWPDEMLSARSHRLRHLKFWSSMECILNSIFKVVLKQDGHCKDCYEWEKRRSDVPVDYSKKPKRY